MAKRARRALLRIVPPLLLCAPLTGQTPAPAPAVAQSPAQSPVQSPVQSPAEDLFARKCGSCHSPLYSLLKLLTPEDEWLATQKLFSEGGHGYGELKASALEPRLLT
jgi:cytochrome c5